MSRCPYDPSSLVGIPLGMFHCPYCLQMIVAGLPHPDYDLLDDDEHVLDYMQVCARALCGEPKETRRSWRIG